MLKFALCMGGAIALIAEPSTVLAQSITAAPDGTGTIVQHNGNTYQIQGGTQAGANLFHSFQALGLSSGEIADFFSNPSVNNIFGRVTGGNPSVIDGLIQVTGANSNLYLMNPAGIVFGQGASLNVGGDFTATTSDRIGFGQSWFNATGANDYAALVGAPNQFAFASEQPGAILNFGDLTSEQDITLMGGTILNQGKVVSKVGNVAIATIPGERFVKLSQPGMLLSLEVPTEALTTEISPVDLPSLLTGADALTQPSPSGRGLLPSPSSLSRVEGATRAGEEGNLIINGEIQGQHIDLYAAGQVTPRDSGLIQGKTRVIRFSDSGTNPDQTVFIDRRADNPEQLLYGAAAGTVSQIIEPEQNGIAVVTEQLAAISDAVGELESVAIVAEGNTGNFWLGSEWLTHATIGNYAASLQSWGDALTQNADILLYSCFTALGATGEALVQSIADLTGADVAASVDATGSANYGGNWELEYSTLSGSIEATNPFIPNTLLNWDGKLATRTVTTTSDYANHSLRDAIAGGFFYLSPAAAGDTIAFNIAGSPTLNLGGPIFWSVDNLTIDGANLGGSNITVAGNGTEVVFSIGAANATLQNLTIQGGFDLAGGGIYHSGTGTLTVTNATVSGNTAMVGGGIYSLWGNIALTNSTVSGNTAMFVGGGIYSIGGNIALNNTTVSGNSVGIYGGGIYSNTGTITLNNSTISGNSAGRDGGGIQNANGNISLTGSTVTGNFAGNDGGGIQSLNASITLNTTTVSNNSANDDGAGIQSENGNITLNTTTVVGNSARDDGGGVQSVNGNIILNSSLVSNNLSGEDGGGIESDNGNVALNNSTVSGNSALRNGGGVNGASVTLDNATVSGNSTGNNGGGIFAMGSVTINDSDVIGNIAGGYGGGVFSYGAVTTNASTVAANIALKEGNNICMATMTASGSPAVNCTTDAQICEELGNCEQTPEATAEEGVLSDNSEGTSTLDLGVEDLETAITNDYDIFAVTDSLALNDIQIVLKTIAQQTDVTPGLVYFTFSSATLAAEPKPDYPELLLASASPDLEGLLVGQQSRQSATSEQLQVILVTQEGTPIVKSVGVDRAQVNQALRRFRRSLQRTNDDRYREPAQQLYDWLIRPLETEMTQQGIENLSIIADQGLRSLPVAALHDGDQFLIEKYSLGLMPSISLVDASYRSLAQARVLAMGASEFVAQSPLPAVPVELQLATQGQTQPPYLNAAFNEANLERQAQERNFEILHLATHAMFQAGAPDAAYVQLWGQEALKLGSFRALKLYEDPALELLILSACETAIGNAEAELGFAGAALQAGVKSVLASLWQVSDLGTLVLMGEFYEQLAQPNVTIKAEALRQAQLGLLRGHSTVQGSQLGTMTLPPELARFADTDLSHPFYWSAFTLVGSPW